MRWSITTFDVRPVTLNFTPSGQGAVNVHAIQVGAEQLFNAVELLECENGCLQTIVCEQCGITGCQPGNWVSLRRLADEVVMTPAVRLMHDDEFELAEYTVPKYFMTRGVPVFDKHGYERLRMAAPKLPDFDFLQECANEEFLSLLQLSAPGGIMGNVGTEPKLDARCLIAVSEGDLDREISSLNALLAQSWQSPRGIDFGRPERLRTFYTDLPGFPEWTPFGYQNDGPHFNIDTVLETEANGAT